MICEEFEILLADYLDGALDRDKTRSVAEHALRCLSCRAMLDDVKARLRDDDPGGEIETTPGLTISLEGISRGEVSLQCARFQELITEFLDGFVPAPTYHRFGIHSAECDSCSKLLTDVVYAVAACHLVHTYEEVDVPATLANRLVMIGSVRRSQPVLGRFRKAIKRCMDPLFYLQSRLAGGSALVFATVASLLIGFSDDMTFAGIYRQAHVKAAAIYDRGVGIYAQKEEVAARVEMMGSDLGGAFGTMDEESADPAGKEKDRR